LIFSDCQKKYKTYKYLVMAEIIRMPLLSDTMKEGVIAEWHKKVGDSVKADDVLAEVETDKATMEVMPYVDGTLLYIGAEKGKAVAVNGIMAIVGNAGEDYKHLLDNNQTQEETKSTPIAEQNSSTDVASTIDVSNIDATVIRMPLLSDTMKEGKIASWTKEVGDSIKSDDVIAEVETDKATMEVLPYVDGTLLYKAVEAGSAVPVNGIMAIVGKAGTDITPLLAADKQPAATTSAPAATTAPTTTSSSPTTNNNNNGNNNSDERVKASPLAKKIAKEKGINLNDVKGTGDGGRIIKRDLDNFTPNTAAPSAAPTTNFAGESYTDKPLSQMRKVIAQRLSDSKFSAPHFYLNIRVKMDNAMAARTQLNNISPVKISFNDFVIKACAQALRKHKDINSSWMGEFIRENNHINIGTAVAIPDGLIVPVIKFADQKTLAEISKEAKELVGKARDKKLQPQEFTGNTFTISNLGMMDIDDFTAIINPPDACILAVGKIEPTPVVENSEIVIRNIMKLTLSCDHRVVDGAAGAAFLQTLKGYLENPVTMLL
jgi:pyruvate dehydrogenase E2 component (dihydrolipoamide acetyltransferase)